MLLRLLAIVMLAAVTLGGVTLVALEGREVVVLRTHASDGAEHATRTWIADADGAAWVEAANPERAFLADLQREPIVQFVRAGRERRCHTTVVANPAGHEHIRRLLRSKYGWADRWIGLLADTRRSLAVRLDCDYVFDAIW